ncbi:hypothetical protein [Mariniflexile sp.]|uniref:hypothetical protein n=1 Tax=Mariniflexile sp. TaxID=1979402 RepID=UPI004048C5C4
MRQLATITLTLISAFIFAQEIPTPKGYEVLTQKSGDLDKDGIDEKIVVHNTTDSTEFGNVREIQILKWSDGNWKKWITSRNAILKSEEGGMMGDPFGEVEIKNGVLLISHYGGSSWKWSYTDKYRFQKDEFELIGYTSVYGKPCEYWTHFDFNISTGKIEYKKEFEDCEKDQEIYKRENEVFYHKGLKINLNNRHLEDIKITTPKYKDELYL